jgi:PAS domain S-box-containing protein
MQLFKKNLKHVIYTAYTLGFIVLLIIAFATYQSFNSALEKNIMVEHTNQVINTSQQVVSFMKDAETGMRGYIITNDSSYLEPYISSQAKVPVHINILDSLTTDNAVQQFRIDTLRTHISEKFSIISQTIALRNRNNTATMEHSAAIKQGKALMDKIRAIIQTVVDEENRLLVVRSEALNRSIEFAIYIIVAVLCSSFFVACMLFFSTKAQLGVRETYEKELDKLNKDLAATNEELLSTNEELSASHEEIAASNEQLMSSNEELKKAEEKLYATNVDLDQQVKDRTIALKKANEAKAMLLARERAVLAEAETQRKRLHSLFLQAPALLAIVRGPDFVFELANPLYLQTLGKKEPIDGKPLAEVIPGLAPGIMDILTKVYHTGERFIGKELPVTVDWEQNGMPYTKYFNLIYEPVREANGRIDGIITFGYEVTDQIKARQQIEESARLLNDAYLALQIKNEKLIEAQQQFQFLTEFIPQIVWRTKSNGDHDYFNKRWYEYTGLGYEESKDRGWSLVLHPEDYERTIKVWTHCLATGDTYDIEYRFRKADGTYRWFLGRALPIRNEKGEIVKWFGTCTDIDEQKHILEHLEESRQELSIKNKELNRINTDLDNFIYTASHDLKSPISNIEGLTSVLLTRLNPKLEKSEKELLNLIGFSVARLKQTIVDLTEITKVQKDADIAVELVLFKEVLEDVKTDIHQLIEESGAQIHTTFEVAQINFAKKNIRSILYNLLSNAIKYRSPDRLVEIFIQTKIKDNFVLLSVRDNGLGIRQDQLDKIFMMFKRAHSHVEGTGIGLYIVKRIIENSGGKIEVNSQEGLGSTFTIYFNQL